MPPKVKVTKEDIVNAAVQIVRQQGECRNRLGREECKADSCACISFVHGLGQVPENKVEKHPYQPLVVARWIIFRRA